MAGYDALQISLAKTLNEEWFQALIEDCRDTIVEKRFIIAEELIKMKWEIGDRILEDTEKFEEMGISGRQIIVTVSKALNCSERELYRCIQFRKKYPDLNNLPEGKAITWHKIVNQYLSDKPRDDDDPEGDCSHQMVEISIRCATCRERLAFRKQDKNSTIDIAKLTIKEKK